MEERFVVSLNDPGEESGKTTRHYYEATSLQDALHQYAVAARARVLGMTERADGSLGATAWRGERLFRIRVSDAPAELPTN